MTTLKQASHQWQKRPADERFWTVADAAKAAKAFRENTRETLIETKAIKVGISEDETDLRINLGTVGDRRLIAHSGHFAFGRLAQLAKAPSDYLRSLPAPLVAKLLNHGLANAEGVSSALVHVNGRMNLHSLNGQKYSRIWDDELLSWLEPLTDRGWRVPPARPAPGYSGETRIAKPEDCLQGSGGIQVRPGDVIAPAGVYVSDHDSFVFLVNQSQALDDGKGNPIFRGVMIGNNLVGSGSCWGMSFDFGGVCGNHIVWSAGNIKEVRVRHTGEAERKARSLFSGLSRSLEADNRHAKQSVIRTAQARVLGDGTKAGSTAYALDLGQRFDIPKKIVILAMERAEMREDRYGDPRTVWAFSNGITEISQEIHGPFADARGDLDRAAGRILDTCSVALSR